MGLMLDFARRVSVANLHLRQNGEWSTARYHGNELSGRSLGLLGFGQIGAKVGRLARAFGMTIFSFDPYVPDNKLIAEETTPCHSIEDLLSRSEFVSLHLPLNSS